MTRRLLLVPGILFIALAGCATDPVDDPADDELADVSDGKADGVTMVVNGHALTARERRWMQYVAEHVVPALPGSRERRLEIAARAAWWSMKEGIFDTSNPPKYNNCNTSSGDRLIGPLEVCGAGRAWQVGLAAVQVPNHTLAELEQLAGELFPNVSITQVLADAAAEAGIDPASATGQAIVQSSGSLRKSWLLRRSAIGFTAVERDEIVSECIVGSLRWCYGTGWDTTRWYAPNKPAAMRAIDEIELLLERLTGGTTTTPWVGSACTTNLDCAFTAGGQQGSCFVPAGGTTGLCSLACEGYCPDQSGRWQTFCVEADAGGGMCVVRAGAGNGYCAALPGTSRTSMDRFLGTSSAPPATVDVCMP